MDIQSKIDWRAGSRWNARPAPLTMQLFGNCPQTTRCGTRNLRRLWGAGAVFEHGTHPRPYQKRRGRNRSVHLSGLLRGGTGSAVREPVRAWTVIVTVVSPSQIDRTPGDARLPGRGLLSSVLETTGVSGCALYRYPGACYHIIIKSDGRQLHVDHDRRRSRPSDRPKGVAPS